MRKDRDQSLPVPTPRTKPANIAAQAISGILEGHSKSRRLTHDAGFYKDKIDRVLTTGDGIHIITGGTDGTVRMWDAASGKCVRTFSCRKSALSGILITPRGDTMITAEPFGSKRIWDLKTGSCLANLKNEPGMPVFCDDSYIFCKQNWTVQHLTGRRVPDSDRSEVIVYSIASGKRLYAIEIDGHSIDSVKVSPDSAKIAVLCNDGSLMFYDLASGTSLYESPSGYRFQDVAGFTPDGRCAVVRSTDSIEVRDMTGAPQFELKVTWTNYRRRYVLRDFLLFEKHVEFASPDPLSTIRVIDIQEGTVARADTLAGDIKLDTITPDRARCLGLRNGYTDIWDLERNRIENSFPADQLYSSWYAPQSAVYLGKKTFVISRDESVMRLISPGPGEHRVVPAGEEIIDVLVTPDGKGLITLGGSTARHWDLSAGQIVREFRTPRIDIRNGAPPGASFMALTPDGKHIVLPSGQGAVLIDLATGRTIRDFQLNANTAGYSELSTSPDGTRLIVAAGWQGFLGSYDLFTGTPTAGFSINNTGAFRAFCAGGDLLFIAQEGVLSLWDAHDGRFIDRVETGFSIQDMAFMQDPEMLAVTSRYGIHFLSLIDGRHPVQLDDEQISMAGPPERHSGKWIRPVPGGRQLLVHRDNCAALWDTKTRRFRWTDEYWRKNRVVKAVPFPDGRRFAAIDTTGMLEIRDIEKGDVFATLRIGAEGFVWETPPDTHAPSGWLFTNREDMVAVISHSREERETTVFRQGDNEHTSYMKIYNNRRMVTARIEGRKSYRQQTGLYAIAMDEARAGIASGRQTAALATTCEKGDGEWKPAE